MVAPGKTPPDRAPGHASLSPTEAARETLRQLATRRIAPTPDNYRTLYQEITGTETAETDRLIETQLDELVQALAAMPATEPLSRTLAHAAGEKSWSAATRALKAFATARLDDAEAQPVAASTGLRDVLAHLLESALVVHACDSQDLVEEGRVLAGRVRGAKGLQAEEKLVRALRDYCSRLEMRAEDGGQTRTGLLRLLRLMVDNVEQLVVEDSWVSGQLAIVEDLLATPPSPHMLDEAEKALRKILLKQGVLRQHLREAKATLKNMVSSFIDRLGALSQDTSDYHQRLAGYSQTIRDSDDIDTVNRVLAELLTDTDQMGVAALRLRDELVVSRDRAEAAERRVRELEEELASASAKIREDQLTGTLNRRGLEEAFSRELARADRHGRPLAVSLLDIDNFKRLNDTYGHHAGDRALKHLALVVKEALRPNDTVARFGGEEFLLLLPDTRLEEGLQVMTRVQRSLTKHFFLHNNERLLLTFSAGVAIWQPGEASDAVVARADEALYRAKKAGKNRVFAAEPATST